jgi:hypothetical protein
MKVYTGSAWVLAYVPGDAASISFAPYSTISSNNVQGAIQELTDEKLDLTGGTLTGNLTAPAFIPNGSTAPSNGVYLPSANNVAISTNGTGRLFVDSSGRVGIGSTSPDANSQLHVVGSSYQPLYINTTGTGGGGAAFLRSGTQALYVGTAGGSWLTGSSTADGLIRSEANLIFGIGNSEKTRIDSSGRLLVGTTSGSGRVTVSGNAIGTTVALTDAATVAVDLSLANYYTLTLGGSRTLGAPSNQNAGQSGVIVITQDGTGSRTLAYNSVWKFPGGTAPTLTTTANAVDVLVYYVESATRITARVLSDVK